MKDRKPFIIEILAVMILISVSFLVLVKNDYYSIMVFSMGVSLMAASIVQLIRITYWNNPKRQDAYEAKKQEAYINRVDERKQYLRMKSGYITYQIMTFLLLILSLILALVRVNTWVIAMTFLLFIFQWGIGVIVFRVLEKKL